MRESAAGLEAAGIAAAGAAGRPIESTRAGARSSISRTIAPPTSTRQTHSQIRYTSGVLRRAFAAPRTWFVNFWCSPADARDTHLSGRSFVLVRGKNDCRVMMCD